LEIVRVRWWSNAAIGHLEAERAQRETEREVPEQSRDVDEPRHDG
jgi:hypothetical protein